jgi:hypothetical protein
MTRSACVQANSVYIGVMIRSARMQGLTRSAQARATTARIAAVGLTAAAAAGCIPVQVQAPDKPIEINLNVTIRQEVIVRLEGAARDLLEANPDIF